MNDQSIKEYNKPPRAKSAENLLRYSMNLFIVMSFSIASELYAQSIVNVRDLDISGVKIDMDYEQAWQAAAKHYQVSVDKLKPNKDWATGRIQRVRHPLTNAELSPTGFSYRKDDKPGVPDLDVSFTTRIPEDKARTTVVEYVTYTVPSTKENRIALRNAALEKYGNPSIKEGEFTMKWCKPKSRYTCDGNELYLNQNQLGFRNREAKDAIVKFLRESNARKPNF
jgi:hypothetical protein